MDGARGGGAAPSAAAPCWPSSDRLRARLKGSSWEKAEKGETMEGAWEAGGLLASGPASSLPSLTADSPGLNWSIASRPAPCSSACLRTVRLQSILKAFLHFRAMLRFTEPLCCMTVSWTTGSHKVVPRQLMRLRHHWNDVRHSMD